MKESEFITPNIYLAAAVVEQTEQYPQFIQQRIISFSFPRTKEVMKTVADFNADVVFVRGFAFSEILKRLRSEMYQMKGSGGR